MIRKETAWSRAFVLMELRRSEALVADLRRLSIGQYPTEQDLANAVQIWDAQPALRMEPCLTGLALVPGGKWGLGSREVEITVTTLIVGDAAQGWVRSLDRLYRTGWTK